jgi:cytochrome b561
MSRIRVSVWLAHPLVALILVAMGVQIAFEVRTELSAAIGHIGLFLFLLATTAVGWLLAWKRPRNALGWLLLAVSALYLIEVPARFLGDVLHGVAPGAAA